MDWHRAGVAQLAAAFRAKQISPVELLGRVLDQCERVNPSINAVIAVDAESALQAAKESEKRFVAEKPLGPMDGIPVSVKDNLFVRKMPATWGSMQFKTHVASSDELPVARLRAKGAVIFGKTNVPEFTLQGYTSNRLFGPTRNPWALGLTPGGSSGGAAAAVASGIGPLAMATDGGGSTRRPAGYANLVGLKPTIGRIPRGGGFAQILYDLEVIGLIGRSVLDVGIFYNAMNGEHPQDRRSWFTVPTHRLGSRGSRSSKKIRLHLDFPDSPVDSEITHATIQAAARLAQLGAQMQSCNPSFSLMEMSGLLDVVFATGLAQLCRHQEAAEELSESLHTMREKGNQVSGVRYLEAITRIWELRNSADEVFGDADFLMTPTSAAMPWPCEVPYPVKIANIDAGPRGHAIFTGFVNLLGLPAISLPARSTVDGLPIGFQLIARYGQESGLLDLATQYEAAFPWAQEWPALASEGSKQG